MGKVKFWEWLQRIAAVLIIGMALGSGLSWALDGPEVAQSVDYSTACYREPGGNTWVCGAGGMMQFTAGSTLSVTGSAEFATLTVTTGLTGDVTGDVTGDLTGDILASGGTSIFDNVTITGTLGVAGAATVSNQVVVDGSADEIQLRVQGFTTQTTDLLVVETAAGADRLVVDNSGNVDVAGTLIATGAVAANGGLAVDTTAFTVADTTGNVRTEGTLETVGAATLASATITGALGIGGNISSAGGAVTFADNVFLDGAADVVQLTVSGYTTQTSSLFVAENSTGTDVFTIANTGNTVVGGTLDVAGASLNFGPNDLYPVGAASSGFQYAWNSETVTGTLVVTHGLTSPLHGFCTLKQAPSIATGTSCAVIISGSTVTVGVYISTTLSAAGADVAWLVIGLP